MEKYNPNDLESTLTYIKNTFGIDTFVEQERLIAYVSDLAPNLKNERSMLKRISALDILEEIIQSKDSDKSTQEHIIAKALTTLVDNEYIQAKVATEYLRILIHVIGLNVSVIEPKEASVVSTQISQQIASSPVNTTQHKSTNTSPNTTTSVTPSTVTPNSKSTVQLLRTRLQQPKKKKNSKLILYAIITITLVIFGLKEIKTTTSSKPQVEPQANVFPDTSSIVQQLSHFPVTLSTDKQVSVSITVSVEQTPTGNKEHNAQENTTEKKIIKGTTVRTPPEIELTPDEQYKRAFQFYIPPHDTRTDIVPNNEEAFKWFLIAAQRGHREAQFWLGHMYEVGEGVEQNYYKAVEWWEKSANQGLPEAQYWLANKYMLGQGVEKNEQKAIELWKKASIKIQEARDELKKRGLYVPDDATEFKGHYYKVFYESSSWHEAVRRCEAEGGYLCTITSEEEFHFITKLLPTRKLFYWLGASDSDSEGSWKWITNEPFMFTQWRDSEPNGGKNENFLVLTNFWDNKWLWNDGNTNDWPSASQYAFICEWSDKTKLPKVQSKSNSIYAATLGNRVRIRFSPTTDSAEIERIEEGTPIEIIASANGDDGKQWFKVIYKNGKNTIEGWIRSDHVIMNRISDIGEHGGKFMRINGEDVNLRTQPFRPVNSAENRVTHLQTGHLVEILETRKVKNYTWYRVFTLKGEQGWVRGDYLRKK